MEHEKQELADRLNEALSLSRPLSGFAELLFGGSLDGATDPEAFTLTAGMVLADVCSRVDDLGLELRVVVKDDSKEQLK